MKKFIAIFAIIATFGFVACNNATESTEENADSLQAEATEQVEEAAPAATDTAVIAADTAVANVPAKK